MIISPVSLPCIHISAMALQDWDNIDSVLVPSLGLKRPGVCFCLPFYTSAISMRRVFPGYLLPFKMTIKKNTKQKTVKYP